MASWRVDISADCIASGVCLALAPSRFALGPDGRSHPVTAVVPADAAVLDAAASCPMEAITVRDEVTSSPIPY
jgi:ferredoxin